MNDVLPSNLPNNLPGRAWADAEGVVWVDLKRAVAVTPIPMKRLRRMAANREVRVLRVAGCKAVWLCLPDLLGLVQVMPVAAQVVDVWGEAARFAEGCLEVEGVVVPRVYRRQSLSIRERRRLEKEGAQAAVKNGGVVV